MSNDAPLMTRDQLQEFIASAAEAMNSSGETAYEPELDDLYYLYTVVRETASISILEFGAGWSTLVLAQALLENRSSLSDSYSVRHPNPFKLLTVDASADWLKVAIGRLAPDLRSLVIPTAARPVLVEYCGTFASLYEAIPFFVPDLIYLDGPDPEQVEGQIGGFLSAEVHGLPMAADLLRLEPHLWPGSMIVTDGRTANARFLVERFTRTWESLHDPFGDRTVFRLSEVAFGQVSEQHLAFRLEAARRLRQKEGPIL